jgi:CRP-like cAMP-binding protein
LPDDAFERWAPHLEFVDLPSGKVLYEFGGPLTHAHFPITAILSLAYVMKDGASAQMAVVGHDGAVGLALFMGGDFALTQAVTQSAGTAFRLKASFIQDEFRQNPRALTVLMRFAQALIMQIAHTAICNRHHSVDQQLCRLLLNILDRAHSNEIMLTQELLANMLGVRREGVTECAQKLQALGAMRYMRGHITVLDRGALEARACECYAAVKKVYDRLLKPGPVSPPQTLLPH